MQADDGKQHGRAPREEVSIVYVGSHELMIVNLS
jgi:hypothetical protein